MRDTGFSGDQLLAMYDRVAGAEDAIPRLRRFVLDLAVRGKLVAQDAADEPASELLKRIEAEKARLVKAGEIRKPRDLADGDETENPFEIPASWSWCRLDTVGAIIGGGTPSSGNPENFAEPGKGIPWLTPADLGGYRELFIERGMRDLTEKGLTSSSATKMPAGTVLFTSRAPIGYVAIAANPISTNQGFKSIVPYVSECSRFIALVMQTFAPEIDAKAPGTTFKEVSGKIVAGVRFPLPPLAEQHRIVAKVAELMGLLDQLEQTRARAEGVRARLTTATWARLTTDAADDPQNARHADFALKTLPALTTTPAQIKTLRQTILNLAVRGKLVAQDPEDEPASVLLERVAVEKARLEKAGTIRKQKPATSVVDDDNWFGTPANWVWTRLVDVGHTQTGTSPSSSKPELFGTDIPFIKPSDLDGDSISYDGPGLSCDGMSHSRLAAPHSVMMVCIGATLGKVNTTDRPVCFNQQINSVTPFIEGMHKFIAIALRSSGFQNRAWARAGTGTLPIISKGKWELLHFPLPPLAEQHRIVAKVDALIALCDQLETALNTTATTKQRLLEPLIRRALSPDDPIPQAAE